MNEKEILAKINEYENTIEELKLLITKLKLKASSFDEFVFQKYIEFSSLPKTMKFINENGYRKPKGTKYTTNDLSALIRNKTADVDPLLLKHAHLIIEHNTKAVSRLW
jgi:hypothetical protein